MRIALLRYYTYRPYHPCRPRPCRALWCCCRFLWCITPASVVIINSVDAANCSGTGHLGWVKDTRLNHVTVGVFTRVVTVVIRHLFVSHNRCFSTGVSRDLTWQRFIARSARLTPCVWSSFSPAKPAIFEQRLSATPPPVPHLLLLQRV